MVPTDNEINIWIKHLHHIKNMINLRLVARNCIIILIIPKQVDHFIFFPSTGLPLNPGPGHFHLKKVTGSDVLTPASSASKFMHLATPSQPGERWGARERTWFNCITGGGRIINRHFFLVLLFFCKVNEQHFAYFIRRGHANNKKGWGEGWCKFLCALWTIFPRPPPSWFYLQLTSCFKCW